MRTLSMQVAVVLLCLGVSLAAAQQASQQTKIDRTGDSPVEAKFAASGHIRMSLCPGGIELTGGDDPMLRVTPDRDARVRINVSGDHADVRISDCPHNNFSVRIELPKSSDLYVRMFAGQLDVRGVNGNKDIELTFGQLNIDAGKSEEYAKVDASVSSGQIDADPFDVHKGGLFRSFDQSGPGKYRLHAHVGAGQIDLR
ncbi:MAG TPA: hypothetical protein VMX38_00085 [Verrucomicrobiae bacterium]|jgi:hypothetical protein|nr:hypothetical protein [Verrucomicrobiae bacterium]